MSSERVRAINPKLFCQEHLVGTHWSLHGLQSLYPDIEPFWRLYHDAIAEEIRERGLEHHTPWPQPEFPVSDTPPLKAPLREHFWEWCPYCQDFRTMQLDEPIAWELPEGEKP